VIASTTHRLAWFGVGSLLLAGCATEAPRLDLMRAPAERAVAAPPPTWPTPTTPPSVSGCKSSARPTGPFTAADARGSSVSVYANPGDARPTRVLASPNSLGNRRVFLVKAAQVDWLKVLLPMRPNGGTGWIRSAEVSLRQHDYQIHVELAAHRLTLWQGNQIVAQEPVGVGKSATPTTCGEFHTTELIKLPDASGPYGPYAFGLSAYSEVLTTFAGGDGQMGIHGTNNPAALGQNVSNGCIRLSNAAITRLAATTPLGTPVTITP
jgi:lipoprotein-anchoring transpeptidase ErfK/SrfK